MKQVTITLLFLYILIYNFETKDGKIFNIFEILQLKLSECFYVEVAHICFFVQMNKVERHDKCH